MIGLIEGKGNPAFLKRASDQNIGVAGADTLQFARRVGRPRHDHRMGRQGAIAFHRQRRRAPSRYSYRRQLPDVRPRRGLP